MVEEKRRKQMTVAIYYNSGGILLGLKKRGFGEGRWNGYGGKVKPGETINGATRREVFEEAGIVVGGLKKMGLIDFEFIDKPGEVLEVHFLRILDYYGEPRETEEMSPGWFEEDSIPYEEMWPDDLYWMPMFLRGEKFRGRILFKDQNTILKNDIRPMNFA
ncbi:MAG: 8-oxo-dGTP diphosphatase [archaeon]|nr:8-oxo-dGTP diphosphatase [archaeon]